MGYSNGKVTAPVNTDDVSAALGVASHDVGTLCTSAKVNPDSLIKPIRITTPESKPFTDYLTQGDFNNPVLDAANGFLYLAGYKIPYLNASLSSFSWANFISKFEGKRWEFQALDYKCLDHFIGYNNSARFEDVAWPVIRYTCTIGLPITFIVFCPDSTSASGRYAVTPFNMPYFKNKYLGVALFKNMNGTWSIIDAKTDTSPICPYDRDVNGNYLFETGKLYNSLSFGNATAGTMYLVIPFISDWAFSSYSQANNAGNIYCACYKAPTSGNPVPSGGMIILESAANTVFATCGCSFADGKLGSTQLKFTIDFTNTWVQQVSVEGKIYIKEYNSQGSAIIASYETETQLGMSVPAKSGTTNGTKSYVTLFSMPNTYASISYQFIGTYRVDGKAYGVQSPIAVLNANGTTTPPAGVM